MTYIKTYEFFTFGKKLPKEEKWEENLKWFFDNYQKVEMPECEVAHNDTIEISWFYKKEYRNYVIFPAKEKRLPVVAISMLEYEDWPEISEEKFNEIKNKSLEIQNYLDEEELKSSSSVGSDSLDLNIDDIDIKVMAANDELNTHFKEYINKELQFEANYYLWHSNSSNEKKQDTIMVKISELELGITTNPHIKVYCEINGEKKLIDIYKETLDEYVDLSDRKNEIKYGFNSLHTQDDERNLTRKDLREKEKENYSKYPRITSMKLVPNKWETIEFIKEIKNILNMLK